MMKSVARRPDGLQALKAPAPPGSVRSQNIATGDVAAGRAATFDEPSIYASLVQRATRPSQTNAAIGNGYAGMIAISRLHAAPMAQTKRSLSEPKDALEQEADGVADAVLRMERPAVAASSAARADISRKCAGCQNEERGGVDDSPAPVEITAPAVIQSELDGNLDGAMDRGGMERDADVEAAEQALRRPGQPLTQSMRSFMEPRFQQRFDHVRTHTDDEAATAAAAINARAFTRGYDIAFGNRQYSEGTEGRRLMAHELTHVLQQSAAADPGKASSGGKTLQRQFLAGPPEQVTTTDAAPPTHGTCRAFNWVVNWQTTRRNGFIVQECINTDRITDCNGQAVPVPNTPHYWEAWSVDGAGNVGDGGQDTWFRGRRPNTRGMWRFDSNVFVVPELDPAAGFRRGAVPTAGGLLSTTTAPTNLYQPSMTRSQGNTWDCCPPKT